MAPSLSLSGFLRASRRNLFPTLVILVLSFLIARHRADHIQMKLEAAFWAPSVPKNGPLPPQRTAEATDAECRAAALAADALVATFEGFGNSMDTDVAAQFNSLRKAMLGPGNCGQGNALEVNRSEPHLEWRKIFKNLQMDLVSSGEPGRPRRLPSLLFPRAATDETRLDLALAVSLVAQQLMATPRASISANTFDQFSARQGYKHWYYGYRRKDLASGIVEDFTLFNNTRNVTLDDGSIEIEHFTNAKRFPAWLAVSNSTHHPAIARRLTNRTSIHTYFATKAWKSDQIAYVGLSGKVQRNADCGDGIMVRIAVDNQTVYERDIPPSKEMVEISWDVHFNVGVGTVVEVQVDPKKDDACDPTLLWARLYDLDAEAQW